MPTKGQLGFPELIVPWKSKMASHSIPLQERGSGMAGGVVCECTWIRLLRVLCSVQVSDTKACHCDSTRGEEERADASKWQLGLVSHACVGHDREYLTKSGKWK